MKKIWLGAALLLLSPLMPAQAADNMNAFPAADEGMVRHVLQLPELEQESAFKVELILGKAVEVDQANSYFFAGTIKQETISGWGFPRYVLSELGAMAGTRMAIDPGAPKVSRFVMVGGDPYLIRYNSKLPVVVYVPSGVEVRYRVWSAGAKDAAINPG